MSEEEPKEEEAEEKVELESPGTMRVFDPFLFLIGNRNAILRIAATPWALLVGAIFVVSAGVARNYDHHVLTQEWIWVGGPFIASFLTTIFVYVWVWTGLRLHQFKKTENSPVFLSLVWMTAPCAWLYGIPVESFTDIVTATKWNIGFLATVSLWRVVLMVRALCVLTGAPAARVTLLVLTPAAMEMMVGAWNKSMSIVGIMGGVRLSPQDELLLSATNVTATLSFWTFLLGCILLFAVKGRAKKPLSRPRGGFPGLAFIPAVLCTLIWLLAAVPFHDEKLRNRQHLKQLIDQQRYHEAAAFAIHKERSGFPSAYYLPPKPRSYRPEHMKLLDQDLPDWLREEWTQNAIEAFKAPMELRRMLRYENDRYNDVFAEFHPAVADALHAYALELEAKPSLNYNERWWLNGYHDVRELAGTQRDSTYD